MEQQVFVRKVSGVIRNVPSVDCMIYGAVSALYGTGAYLVWGSFMFPGANPWISIILSGIFAMVSLVGYAMLGSAMPRSGGEYVFQSRILTGIIGFVFVTNTYVIWNMYWSYGAALGTVYAGISPLLSYLGVVLNNQGLIDLGLWMTDAWVIAGLCIVLLLIATVVLLRGTRLFFLFQRYFLMLFAGITLLIVLGLLLVTSREAYAANFNTFASSYMPPPAEGWYNGIINKAVGLGYNPYREFSWWDTLGLGAVVYTWMMWSAIGVALFGEVKGANSLRSSVIILCGACALNIIFFLVTMSGVMQVIGMPFLASLGFISFNAPDMLPLPAFAYMPLPGYMVISFLYLQPIVALFLGLGFMSAVSQSLFNSPLGASRVMLADAVDRLLPEQISRVNKRGAPYVALIVVQVVAILFAVTITLYPGLMGYLTAGAIGSQLVMVFTMLSAMLFPYSAKRIFEVSPSAKYKIAGLPLVSVIGAVGLVYCLVMTSYMIIVPEFGFRGTPVILFIAIYVGLFIYYYGAKWYRSRQGIDVGLAFKEVPPA